MLGRQAKIVSPATLRRMLAYARQARRSPHRARGWLVRSPGALWPARLRPSPWRPLGRFQRSWTLRARASAGKRRETPTGAGLAAVSDTRRTLARLCFDIIGLFPLLRPPIREQHRPIPEGVSLAKSKAITATSFVHLVGAGEQRQRTRETRGLSGLHAGLQRMDRRLPRVRYCCGPTSRNRVDVTWCELSGVSRERRSAKAMRHLARRSNPRALPA